MLVAALDEGGALGRTFELYADTAGPPADWAAFFAPLVPDAKEQVR